MCGILRNILGRCHLKWDDLSPKEGKVSEPGQDKAEKKIGKNPCRPRPGQRKTLEVKHRMLILVLRDQLCQRQSSKCALGLKELMLKEEQS